MQAKHGLAWTQLGFNCLLCRLGRIIKDAVGRIWELIERLGKGEGKRERGRTEKNRENAREFDFGIKQASPSAPSLPKFLCHWELLQSPTCDWKASWIPLTNHWKDDLISQKWAGVSIVSCRGIFLQRWCKTFSFYVCVTWKCHNSTSMWLETVPAQSSN